ncbi:MAG: acyl-CoA dehydrogenase family protein [Pseudolabrys sp.]
MDFVLSDEQRLLKESVARLFADQYDFNARKNYREEPGGWSRKMWAKYADLGLLGLPFQEEYGGSGGGPVETMVVMETLGRSLALEPYLATVVLCGGLLRLGGSEAMRAGLLPKIASGDLVMAFAHAERQARYDLADVVTTARRDGDGYIIDGNKTLVLHGDSAGKFIVSARLSGGQRDRDGLGLFLIDAKAPGVSVRGYPTVDGLRAAELSLNGARSDAAIGDPGAAFPLIEQVVDAAMAALCSEAVGAMAAMHELTVDYMKTRKQFGTPIGGFQVLQHRAADMLIALEQARSMAMLSAMTATDDNVRERRQAVSAAKVQIGRSGRLIGQHAIQIHGGIGMTMEASIGHYFKRVTMIDTMFGDADYHLGLLAESGGLVAA